MDAMLILRTFTSSEVPGDVGYLMMVADGPDGDGPEWVFGGRQKRQDDALVEAWLILTDLAAQVARRMATTPAGDQLVLELGLELDL